MWYLVEIWWDNFDDGDTDYFGVWAKSKNEAKKIAKKWAPKSAEDVVITQQNTKYVDDFIKFNMKLRNNIDFVVDKSGKMHRVHGGMKIYGSLDEAPMGKTKEVKVYDKDRKKVLATVNSRATSIGAAKAAGAKAAQYAKVNGEYAWVVKESINEGSSNKYRVLSFDVHGYRGDDLEKELKKYGIKLLDGPDENDEFVVYGSRTNINKWWRKTDDEDPFKSGDIIKENYTHFPSLKKLVNVSYTDPRAEGGNYKIHAEVDGACVVDGKAIDGTYIMYEDDAYPGNYIAVHVANEVNEESDEPMINVVAMDKNKKLVRDRMAYRRRKSKAAVNEALNEMFLGEANRKGPLSSGSMVKVIKMTSIKGLGVNKVYRIERTGNNLIHLYRPGGNKPVTTVPKGAVENYLKLGYIEPA